MSIVAPTVTIRARSLAFGGEIVGEVSAQQGAGDNLLGITAFVPFAIPGEQVLGRVTEQKKRYVRAELISVEEPATSRITPRCHFFGSCGGCELQHIDYETQCQLKYDMVRGALASGKHTISVLQKLQPVVRSEPYGYRRRVSLHVDRSGGIGFYRSGSRAIVMIDSCPVASDAINNVLARISGFGAHVRGRVSSIQLESDPAGVIAVFKSPYDLGTTEIKSILDHARKYFDNAVLISGAREVGGFGRQILELPLDRSTTLTACIPAGFFSQVNWEINLQLIERVVTAAEASHGKGILDLYSGAGNFSFALARSGARVTAVESDARLVAFGRQNSARNHLERGVTFIESSVERFLQSNPRLHDLETIVADPPRSGLGAVLDRLPETKRFLLISCHLPSFVRDLKGLTERGYEVEEIIPYDMFAQTSYLEILAVLRHRTA